MTKEDAFEFANEWIDAWNSRDMARIVAPCAPEIEFFSPNALRRLGNGRVSGLAALTEYWKQGLAGAPQLRYRLINVAYGFRCLTILYRNHRGEDGAETFELREDGKVVRTYACFAQPADAVSPAPASGA